MIAMPQISFRGTDKCKNTIVRPTQGGGSDGLQYSISNHVGRVKNDWSAFSKTIINRKNYAH